MRTKRDRSPPTEAEGFRRIPRSRLREFVGRVVHTDWAGRGCIFLLERVEGPRAYLVTPKTGRRTVAATGAIMATKEDSRRLDEERRPTDKEEV